MGHALLQLIGAALHRPFAEVVEDGAFVETLAITHGVDELDLRIGVAHMNGAHQAVGPVRRMRFDKAQLAENGDGAGGSRRLHGEQLRLRARGKIGVGDVEEQGVALPLDLAQLAVEHRHAFARGRHVGKQPIVDRLILAAEQQMHARRGAVTARSAAHLIEFDLVERHMVHDHMAYVRDVDAFAERRGRNEDQQLIVAEQLLDATTVRARKARIVETDEGSDLRCLLAQAARQDDGLLARVHEHDRLLARCHQVRQVIVARGDAATVVEHEVRTPRPVVNACLDGQLALDGGQAVIVGRRGERQHARVAQTRYRTPDARVGFALAGVRKPDVVRLVDDHEANAPRDGEGVGVPIKELRRGQHDVDAAVLKPREGFPTLVGSAFAGERRHGDAEARQGFTQMERLIRDERAQRVDEQARLVVRQGAQGGVHLEGERFATAGDHDAKGRTPLVEIVENGSLGRMELALPDERAHDPVGERGRVLPGGGFPFGAVLLKRALVFLDGVGVVRGIGDQVLVARSVQIGHEALAFGAQARLEPGAGARGADRFEHGLDAAAVAPFVDLHLEGRIDDTVAAHERFDVVAMEHDACHDRATVGHRAREMVALGADRATAQQRDVARQIDRDGMFLAERRERVELGDVSQGQLVEVDAGIDVDERVEGALGQRIHVRAQAPLELGKVFGRKGDAHRGLMTAEAYQQVGAAFDGLEQVDLAHRAPRAAGLIAIDGEQQGGHAVGADQPACDDALDALMPAIARNHERALAVIRFGRLHLGDLRKLRLDGAPLVVNALKLFGKRARLAEIVGEQQAQRQIGIAHAPGRVQARNEREA